VESLALKYRPRSFDDLVGQRVVHVLLRQMVNKHRVHPALIFSGVRGTGKTTTLRCLAAALNCDTPPGPCGHCPSCKAIFDGTSPHLIEIDAASNGLVDDIRQLRQHVLYAVPQGWRVIGLDEAQSISTAGFNALLKMFEEPPAGTVFVLLTTEPDRIPDTVRSRCMTFSFTRITIADITARLAHICQQEGINAHPHLLHAIAERADGGMRDAVMLLDQVTSVGITTADQFADLLGDTDPGPALLATVRTGDAGAALSAAADALTYTGEPATLLSALTAVLRDMCILRAGGDLPAQGEALEARRQLATTIDAPTTLAALRILWDAKTRTRVTDDPRITLDLTIAMLSDLFTPPTPSQPPTVNRPLTLAEMAGMRR
jgi:DNA polymerase-3 subunit gamma/tau